MPAGGVLGEEKKIIKERRIMRSRLELAGMIVVEGVRTVGEEVVTFTKALLGNEAKVEPIFRRMLLKRQERRIRLGLWLPPRR